MHNNAYNYALINVQYHLLKYTPKNHCSCMTTFPIRLETRATLSWSDCVESAGFLKLPSSSELFFSAVDNDSSREIKELLVQVPSIVCQWPTKGILTLLGHYSLVMQGSFIPKIILSPRTSKIGQLGFRFLCPWFHVDWVSCCFLLTGRQKWLTCASLEPEHWFW